MAASRQTPSTMCHASSSPLSLQYIGSWLQKSQISDPEFLFLDIVLQMTYRHVQEYL